MRTSNEPIGIRQGVGNIAFVSATIGLLILFATGLIEVGGRWYSPSLPYRLQTENLLDGRLSLADDPTRIERGLAWGRHGVVQVWGLGVAVWRLPFEAVARIFGADGCPDRIAFGVALALAACAVIGWVVLDGRGKADDSAQAYAAPEADRMMVMLIFLAFPPFLTLLRGRFLVYEEAIAYGYLCSIILFCGLIALVRRPSASLYYLLCAASGLVGFVRPTLLAYGFATVMLAVWRCRAMGWPIRRWATGCALFVCGGALLLLSNLYRFGAGLEFGHRLTIVSDELMYLERFGAPFSAERLIPAARELLGAIFFVPVLNGMDVYRDGIIPGQSSFLRWRHFYHSTFDPSYLLILALCWSAALYTRSRTWRTIAGSGEEAPVLQVAGVWSFTATSLLFLFYWKFLGISSRYIADFAPAFAVALFGCVSAAGALWPDRLRSWRPVGITLLFAVWWTYQVSTARQLFPRQPPLDHSEMKSLLARSPGRASDLPTEYSDKTDFAAYGITGNGFGWTAPGQIPQPMVLLFGRDIDQVVLDLEPTDEEGAAPIDYSDVRVKLGLDALRPQRTERFAWGTRLTFQGRPGAQARDRVDMVAIALLPPGGFRQETPPFRVARVRLRDSGNAIEDGI